MNVRKMQNRYQNSVYDTLRNAMRSKIYAILKHKFRPAPQRQLIYNANAIEAKLMKLAKSEEKYSNLRDLEQRINFVLRDLRRRFAQPPTRPPIRRVVKSGTYGISSLPDCLLTLILLNLTTKDSVKTSVLSRRWRNVWLNVPGLELDSNDFPYLYKDALKNLSERFLEFNRGSSMQKFKIKYDENNIYLFGVSEWIGTVLNRGAQYLDVDTLGSPVHKDFMPMEIYKNNSLVSLKLVNVALPNPEFVVSLPCLKILHLDNVLSSKDDPLIMEKIISGCSVLEDLTVCTVYHDHVPVLLVRSRTLKRFWVRSRCGGIGLAKEYGIVIHAPGLKYMNFRVDKCNRVVAKNLSSLFLIDIDTEFNVGYNHSKMKNCTIRDFLTEVSSVRHMIISQPTLEVLYLDLKLGHVSKFNNLSRLEGSFCTLLLQVLPDVLESFPNLKHLKLFLLYLRDLVPEDLELTTVPQCLLSSLECVEIEEVTAGVKRAKGERSMSKAAKHKRKIWMKAVKYILENALVLKKLILSFTPQTYIPSDISKELPTFTKRSPICEICIKMVSL